VRHNLALAQAHHTESVYPIREQMTRLFRKKFRAGQGFFLCFDPPDTSGAAGISARPMRGFAGISPSATLAGRAS
jgi:hypothetical protein